MARRDRIGELARGLAGLFEKADKSPSIEDERRYRMQLKDIMTRGVEVIHPDATLQEAAQQMRGLDVGPLPVCDGERLVGMLTDRDITVRATAEGRDPKATKVRDVMTCEVIYAFEDQGVTEAARLMEEHQVRRLVVLNRDKRLIGIVSLGDLAVHTDNQRLAGEVVERVSEPAEPKR
jgi:CBS domain-containing protein